MKNKQNMKIIFFGDSLTKGTIGASYFNILEKKLSSHTLINYGKNGDPVVGLYNRMTRLDKNETFDIAFVWIGTNDIFVNVKWHYPIMKTLTFQQWARNNKEFEEYYKKILDMIKNRVKKIFTVSPWLLGEDIENKWNKELAKLSILIEKISKNYENIEFIDIRSIIIKKLSKRITSDYLPTSNTGVFFDYMTINNDERIDKISSERGLHFTIDGAHLNNHGARIVADVFYDEINKY